VGPFGARCVLAGPLLGGAAARVLDGRAVASTCPPSTAAERAGGGGRNAKSADGGVLRWIESAHTPGR